MRITKTWLWYSMVAQANGFRDSPVYVAWLLSAGTGWTWIIKG